MFRGEIKFTVELITVPSILFLLVPTTALEISIFITQSDNLAGTQRFSFLESWQNTIFITSLVENRGSVHKNTKLRSRLSSRWDVTLERSSFCISFLAEKSWSYAFLSLKNRLEMNYLALVCLTIIFLKLRIFCHDFSNLDHCAGTVRRTNKLTHGGRPGKQQAQRPHPARGILCIRMGASASLSFFSS